MVGMTIPMLLCTLLLFFMYEPIIGQTPDFLHAVPVFRATGMKSTSFIFPNVERPAIDLRMVLVAAHHRLAENYHKLRVYNATRYIYYSLLSLGSEGMSSLCLI